MMKFCRINTNTLAAFTLMCMSGVLGVMNVAPCYAVKIQDLTRIKGSESNVIHGMGLVVGLAGTGDSGKYATTMRQLATLINRLGDELVTAEELSNTKNVAVVHVTATIPETGAREGDRIDIQVASYGDAQSLAGGRLILTPLVGPIRGSGNMMFAMAQGSIALEDMEIPTVGVIRQGGRLTRDLYARYMDEAGRMTLVIESNKATWPMANMIATLVNDVMSPDGPPLAIAIDQKNIIIQIPENQQSNPSAFIAQILEIELDASLIRTEARVVINEKTETIIITGEVELSPVVISHKGLTITTITPPIDATPEAPRIEDQPFIAVDPQQAGGAKLADLLNAFNQLKVPAKDRIEIIKQIHRSGKLHAQLIIED